MSRTITVRGTGRVTAAPDCIELTLTLEAKDFDYSAAMEKASAQITALQGAIRQAGFAEDELKTTDFNIRSDYEGEQDEKGRFRQVFTGYACVHTCKLRFALDMQRLSATLTAVGDADAPKLTPELHIAFTVREPEAVTDALLRDAAENARKNAQTLCAASGVTLGALESIRYDWEEVNVYSRTRFGMGNAVPEAAMAKASFDASFTPEDIKVSDSATFVWTIE